MSPSESEFYKVSATVSCMLPVNTVIFHIYVYLVLKGCWRQVFTTWKWKLYFILLPKIVEESWCSFDPMLHYPKLDRSSSFICPLDCEHNFFSLTCDKMWPPWRHLPHLECCKSWLPAITESHQISGEQRIVQPTSKNHSCKSVHEKTIIKF